MIAIPKLSVKHLRFFFGISAFALGVLQAWLNRHDIIADGLSYLDMGDAFVRGDWGMAFNSIWSPLYPWMLGVAIKVLGPSPFWESSVIQLVDLIIYAASICCFDFFLRQLNSYIKEEASSTSNIAPIPEYLLITAGYILFIWSSTKLIGIHTTTPDLMLTGFIFAAFGILVRIRRGATSWSSFVVLGLVLGLGYWAKAPMFLFAFVFMVVAMLLVGHLRKGMQRAAIALAVFLVIVAPLIMVLSISNHRLTFGSSGPYNYARTVNSVAIPVHWQGGPSGLGTPLHPTRKVFDKPVVYEFGTPIGGTYPIWQDPYYWYDGITPHFDMKGQLRVLSKSVQTHASVFGDMDFTILFCFLLLAYLGGRKWEFAKDFSKQWFLLIPPIVALFMYSLLFVSPRYVGAFAVVTVLAIFSSLRLPQSSMVERVCKGMAVLIALFWFGSLGTKEFDNGRSAFGATRSVITSLRLQMADSSDYTHWQVAKALKNMGAKENDKVAYIGESYHFYWARLAGVQIVAEIRQFNTQGAPTSWADDSVLAELRSARSRHVDIFWNADSLIRARIMKTFAHVGVSVVVVDSIPTAASSVGWQRVPNTSYYLYSLSGM